MNIFGQWRYLQTILFTKVNPEITSLLSFLLGGGLGVRRKQLLWKYWILKHIVFVHFHVSQEEITSFLMVSARGCYTYVNSAVDGQKVCWSHQTTYSVSIHRSFSGWNTEQTRSGKRCHYWTSWFFLFNIQSLYCFIHLQSHKTCSWTRYFFVAPIILN